MIPKRAISVHFPKAAGTALWRQFASALGDDLLLVWDQDPLAFGSVESKPFPDRKRLVHGHFHPATYLDHNAYMFTFLRHPIQNAISIYYFWKTVPNPGKGILDRFHTEKPSIETFAAYKGIRTLMSEVYFGGFDMSRFNFIGFHERRAEDIPRLSIELGLSLDHCVYENKTDRYDERFAMEEDPRLKAALANILREDIRFYEAMLAAHS